MYGDRVSLFRRAKVVKKSSKAPATSALNVVQPVATQTSYSLPEKRPAPTEASSEPLFSNRHKSIAHKLPRSKILDLTVDHLSSIFEKEAPEGTACSIHSTSDSLQEEQFDSAPKDKIGNSVNYLGLTFTLPGGFKVTEDSTLRKKSDAFRASCPLLLERIGMDYESFKDVVEVHGTVTRHLIKVLFSFSLSFSFASHTYFVYLYVQALNASYVIARRTDLLDDAHEEAYEKEMDLQLHVKELEEENGKLKVTSVAATNEKKEATAQAMRKLENMTLYRLGLPGWRASILISPKSWIDSNSFIIKQPRGSASMSRMRKPLKRLFLS
ncbi:hypothetical protein LIER_06322 [Lithospermum erythrorhizon]|uniref:Uncharacterized protein n=1 Tax=Lithospermum erythrorhizon TaxID=34254 RepID=A0AAV3P431_LITER